MSEYAIEIDNLVKKFSDLTAVNNISFKIKRGEIFGLLGPNGAGKTTTLNVILGLLKATSGKVFINGLDVSKDGETIKREIGLMTQETVVEPDLTAAENLEIFAELYHVPKDEIPGRVGEALKEAELVQFANKRAGTFSGGMKRRLELVKSMIQRPKILILDEPTTGLDIQNRTNMWEHIKELNRDGVTIILTTQYLEEADTLCDRIAVIDHGKIKAIGTATELKRLVGSGRILDMTLSSTEKIHTAVSVLRSVFKIDPTVKGERITAVIQGEKANASRILAEMDKRKIDIASISLHMPTLDDVFIKLTGAALRDETGEMKGGRGSLMMGRGGG